MNTIDAEELKLNLKMRQKLVRAQETSVEMLETQLKRAITQRENAERAEGQIRTKLNAALIILAGERKRVDALKATLAK